MRNTNPESYLDTHAIRNKGFSVRAIIFLNNLLQNTFVVRQYLIHKHKKQKKDAVAANDNIQSGNAIATEQNVMTYAHVRQSQLRVRLDRNRGHYLLAYILVKVDLLKGHNNIAAFDDTSENIESNWEIWRGSKRIL